MKHLLEQHFETEVVFSNWFWKHSLPPTSIKCQLPHDLPIIVMTKDPFRFNESLYEFWRTRRPNLDRGKNLSEFVNKPLIVYEYTKGKVSPEYLFPSPTGYWNQYHFSWLHWRGIASRLSFVQVESLQKNPLEELLVLASKYNLRKTKSEPIELPTQAIAPSQDGKITQFAKVKVKPLEKLREIDITVINEQLDSAVARDLGYTAWPTISSL